MDFKLILRRFFAFAIDWIIALGGFELLMLFGPGSDPSYYYQPSFKMFLSAGFWMGLAFLMLYTLFRDCIFGRRSLGKLICGLKIVNSKTGNYASCGRLILRNLTNCLLYVEMILVLTPLNKRLGDLIAGTRVERSKPKQINKE